MPTKREVAEALSLNPNHNSQQIYNRAIRLCVPGGNMLLDRLELIDGARQNYVPGSEIRKSLDNQITWLNDLKDLWIAALQEGTLPARKLP